MTLTKNHQLLNISRNLSITMVIFFLALILCLMFGSDFILPLSKSLLIFFIVCFWIVFGSRLSPLPLLVYFATLTYVLPFLHLYEYLFNPYLIYQQFIWGLWGNEYQRDLEIVRRVAMVAVIGLCGLAAGYQLAKSVSLENKRKPFVPLDRPLTLTSFLIITIFGFFLSWIYAPVETILQANYTQASWRLTGTNLNAVWMVSYIFIALLFIDVYFSSRLSSKIFKRNVAFGVTAIVIVWLEFMRGKRDCIGLIFALAAISFQNLPFGVLAINKQYLKKKMFITFVFFLLTFISAQYLGVARSSSAGRKSLPALGDLKVSYVYSTWSAVLLTPFSVIGDLYYHRMESKKGSTYIDMLKSLPPGFITKWLGVERAIEGTHGPAWEMRYGLGGTHVTAVPFMNFGATGVFWVLLIYGFLIGETEMMMRSPTVLKTLFYATFFIMLLVWFWYGEMSFIRGLMAFVVVVFIYKLLPKKRLLEKK